MTAECPCWLFVTMFVLALLLALHQRARCVVQLCRLVHTVTHVTHTISASISLGVCSC